jgi:hypothetical protein
MTLRKILRFAPPAAALLTAAACSSGGGNAGTGTDASSSADGYVAPGRDGSRGPAPGSDGGTPGTDGSRKDGGPGGGTDSSLGGKDGAAHDSGKPACASASDCDGGECKSGVCVPATCTDGQKDGNETDVDCGGSCPACGAGLHCLAGSDCSSLDCKGTTADAALTEGDPGTCKAATCTDGIENEGESDIDCGGSACPACASGKKCVANTDCASTGCDYTKHCALAPSCTQHHGGDTCGAGEDTDLGATPTSATGEESCCTTIPIPGTTFTVDKYFITAGRIRAWVTRLGGNLRAFTQSIPATNPYWNPQWNQYIPSTTSEVDLQLGPYPAPLTPSPYPPTNTTVDADGEPSGNWLGQWRDGCSMGSAAKPDGARTWWTDYAIGSDEAPIVYPQDFLDDKMINCIDSYMLTAFCIWDGGHLATDAEMSAAWGPGPFPWSGVAPAVLIDQTSQEPSGTDSMMRDASSYVVHEFGLSADEFIAPFTYNYDPYGLEADNTYHIGAPGRFPLGNGPSGHSDLAGAAYEATSIKAGTFTQEPPPTPTSVKQVDHVGTLESGSWEIHPIISGSGTAVMFDPWMPAYWAYWAMTGRCGR